MRAITWNLVLSTWLFLSAFLFTRTPVSIMVAVAVAVAVLALALASGWRPALRYGISALAVALGFAALLVPDVSGAAQLSDAMVAAALFAVSLVSPLHAPREEAAGAKA